MGWTHIAGYLAAGLVFSTFCMKTMMPLRIVAIASNCAFIAYAILGDLYPILILHGAMLPLNLFRLHQIRRLSREVAAASHGHANFDWLVPMMSKRRLAKGETLFRKGEEAHEIFFVSQGTVRIVEIDRTIGPGHLIGEIGVFSPVRERTQTVACDTDVEVFFMTDRKFFELYYQNPNLGLEVVRLIVGRMLDGLSRTEDAGGAQPDSSSVSQ